jgi:RNA polymerase sigma factor (sigma-70 family)
MVGKPFHPFHLENPAFMDNSVANPRPSSRRRYVMAVVLGTALSALAPATSLALDTPAVTTEAVADMSRYCTTCWRNARLHPDLWTDCTQEVFSRLLERVEPESWGRVLGDEGDERREFLRAIDAVKKRTQRSRKWSSGLIEQAADPRDTAEHRRADEIAAVQDAAREVLSPRQQRILQMSFEGWTVQETAEELGIPAERVSDEKYKAIRKLRQHLRVDEEVG